MERLARPAGQRAGALELHIEEVVLRGFAAGDRRRLGEALEPELARLLADGGLAERLAGDVEVLALDGGAFVVPPGARGEQVGALIAQAVYGGLQAAVEPPARPAVGGGAPEGRSD